MSKIRQKSKKALFDEKLAQLIGEFGPAMFEKEILKKNIIKKVIKEEPKKILTFEEAENLFFTSPTSYFVDKREETQRGYKSEMRSFKGFIEKELTSGTKVLITEVFNKEIILKYLNKQQNMGTRKKKSSFLRAFLKSVAKDILDKKQVDFLLGKTLKIKDNPNCIPKALTSEQINFILEAAKETTSALRNYAIFWTLLGSGIRANELVNIQIKDIDWNDKAILIMPKGKSEYEKRYMTDVSFDVMSTYVQFMYADKKERYTKLKYSEIYIFSTNGTNALATSTIREMMNNIKKRGIQEKMFSEDASLSPHILRHTFSLYAYESGMEIYKISKLLGHENINTTQTYLRLLPDQVKKELEKHPYANVELEYLKQKEALYGKFAD
ncbi:site-specific integrase [Bacillus sp. 31A1R]|uniref:Site-specific integrase n=1 Tax=Robertmurraya mangrovi TaxID=3098077 RepID=A0ABU5IZW0_9BACI|nr:site-specific integrase [Bacillus sp. 31A1R]MDZ5472677.1 site-specific integrase [Bacillus sp. 31A1R]